MNRVMVKSTVIIFRMMSALKPSFLSEPMMHSSLTKAKILHNEVKDVFSS